MDQPRALDHAIDDLPTARALIATAARLAARRRGREMRRGDPRWDRDSRAGTSATVSPIPGVRDTGRQYIPPWASP